jgi:hypothetical protein
VNVGVAAIVGRDALKEFIPYQRIDLGYEVATCLLSIQIKYVDLLAEDPIVATILNFLDNYLSSLSNYRANNNEKEQ